MQPPTTPQPAPFAIAPELWPAIKSMLHVRDGMLGALWLLAEFEQRDEQGNVELHFTREHFMIAYDNPEKLAAWPRVTINGTTLIVDSHGLARLTGHTLTSQEIELHYVNGEKETRKFMVAV